MDARYARIGVVTRSLGGASIADRLLPHDNVRVVMTHSVPHDHFGRFAQIVDRLSSTRAWLDPADFLRTVARDSPSAGISGRSLVLTFDDGLLSSYEAAKSILRPRGIRAIFFVPTRILELRTRTQMRDFVAASVYYGARSIDSIRSEEYLTMSAEQLRDLHRDGHLILPHTHSHVLARDIATERDVERELIRPRGILEDLLGSPADALALPVGTPPTVSAYAYRRIANAYSVCFTAVGGANTSATNPLFIRRDSVHPWYSVEHAQNIVDGLYDPYFALRARLLRRRAGPLPRPRSAGRAGDEGSTPSGSARASFVRRVTDAFGKAAVDYVVLHGDLDHRDSDLDLALSRDSLDVADAIIRSGAFGRVVQCFHYDVPWCHYYVLETDEAGRAYRQIDIACDPWGIGRYGATVRTALSQAVLAGKVRVPAPAAETLYLAAKRARKKAYDTPKGIDDLEHAFARDPLAATELLQAHFGSAGSALATALRHGSDTTDALARIRRRLTRRRCAPLALALRTAFAAQRITARLLQPTGLVVAIVGGTDAASSLLVTGIERRMEGAFRRTLALRSQGRVDGHRPGRRLPRIGYLRFDALMHGWPRVPVARARSTLVIVECGRIERALDPRRDRVAAPAWVKRLLGWCLSARPDVTVSAERSSPSAVALERAVAAVNDCLAARQRDQERRGCRPEPRRADG